MLAWGFRLVAKARYDIKSATPPNQRWWAEPQAVILQASADSYSSRSKSQPKDSNMQSKQNRQAATLY